MRASTDALPVASASVDAVCAAMCFPVLTPLEDVLTEVRRVLRPGGTVVALVPSGRGYGVRGLVRWARLMRTLGVRSPPWPNPEARDGLARILRAHGFVLDRDLRRMFRREIAHACDAALVVDGLYLPEVEQARLDAAKTMLASRARTGRWLPFPLRRVVAHLPADS